MPTNVPPVQFGPNGFISPTEQAILAGVQEDINAAFGGDLNPALETPQGQVATTMTAIIGAADDMFCNLTNMVDPAFASGRMQDAIARIYFIERNPAQPTVVQGVCTGLDGVNIPVGALAVAADGNVYSCTEAGTIPIGGSISLSFQCNVTGPIQCPAGTLNTIYQAIPGWDSINNPADGVIGNNVETRAAFETRRAQSVALNSVGSLPSILGAVLTVADVIDAFVTENENSVPTTVGDYTLLPNSLYVAVVGGDATAVAQAIWSKKAPGCAYNGNTVVSVEDTNPLYTPPYPTYSVKFEIPASLAILFDVVIAQSTLVPANAAVLVQNAIISAFAGGDGGPRARIGTKIYASRFYPPIAALGAWAQIVSIQLGSTNQPDSVTFNGSIAGITLTVASVVEGTIEVGQTIIDGTGAITVGTTIVALGTGTGGVGTYVVSNPQTVTSETMIAAVADWNDIPVYIDQEPTINAANIAVSFM